MSKFFDETIQGLLEAAFIENKRKELIYEDDHFEIPEEYKNMTIEELREAKEKLLSQIRPATEEEIQSVEDYIGSISESIGINFHVFYDNFDTPSVCNQCNNNPKNGGSGICNCTLGLQTIY